MELHASQRELLERFRSDPRTTRLRVSNQVQHSFHTAILVRRGKVLAYAANQVGSRSRGSGYSDHSIHAERNVVKELGDISQLRGADMYVMRVSRKNEFAASKPCAECQVFLEKCMREYGLRKVYYTVGSN